MPRYYFHVKDTADYKDEHGVELPDLAAAREQAVQHFGEVLQAYAGGFTGASNWRLTVADHRGHTALKFSFAMDGLTCAEQPCSMNVKMMPQPARA